MKPFLLILLSFITLMAEAQDILPITKAEVLAKVRQNNYTLKIAQQDLAAAQAAFDQTKASYLPHIQLSYAGIGTDNPLMAFGSKLNQQRIAQSDFIPASLNDPDVISNFTTRLEVRQPIVNLDSKYYQKAAQAKIEATQWQMARKQDYLELEVEKTYIQLQLAYRMEVVLEQVQNTVLENKRLAENSLRQGLLQSSDLLAIDVRATEVELQLQQARTNIANVSNYLAVLMNAEGTQLFQPLDSLVLLAEGQLPTEVSTSRADLKAMQSATAAYEHLYTANEKSFYPRLNAFATYELHDKTPLTDAGGFLLGVQVTWNILEGTKRYGKRKQLQADLEKSKLQQKQYLSQSQLELNQANRRLADAQYQIRLSGSAAEQSKEVLRIKTNRYAQGLEKTTDLLMAETQYTQKQMELYSSIAQYNMALAHVRFLSKQ